jgi:hypothetical protein
MATRWSSEVMRKEMLAAMAEEWQDRPLPKAQICQLIRCLAKSASRYDDELFAAWLSYVGQWELLDDLRNDRISAGTLYEMAHSVALQEYAVIEAEWDLDEEANQMLGFRNRDRSVR